MIDDTGVVSLFWRISEIAQHLGKLLVKSWLSQAIKRHACPRARVQMKISPMRSTTGTNCCNSILLRLILSSFSTHLESVIDSY